VSGRVPGRPGRRGRMIAGDGPLARVPVPAVFAVVVIVFAAGVLVGGVVGAVLLGLLALGVAGLLAATWPVLGPGERAVRVLVLAVLVAIAIGLVLR
jgi:hypothetical protein